MTVLGASGSVGSVLAREAPRSGREVTAVTLTRARADLAGFMPDNLEQGRYPDQSVCVQN
jgi:nucleoside-diphosphate-sugar epimerase